jgi:hypothetical protein
MVPLGLAATVDGCRWPGLFLGVVRENRPCCRDRITNTSRCATALNEHRRVRLRSPCRAACGG